MAIVARTAEEVRCGTFNSEDQCLKLNAIPCGYDDASEASCAKLNSEPQPTVCDEVVIT